MRVSLSPSSSHVKYSQETSHKLMNCYLHSQIGPLLSREKLIHLSGAFVYKMLQFPSLETQEGQILVRI